MSAESLQVTEETVQIGFRGTVEYRTKLAQEALNRGIKVQTLIERAVSAYLAGIVATQNRQNSEPNFSTITPISDVVSGTLIEAARELAAAAPPELIHTAAAMLRAIGALIHEKRDSDQTGGRGSVRVELDADAIEREIAEIEAATDKGAESGKRTG